MESGQDFRINAKILSEKITRDKNKNKKKDEDNHRADRISDRVSYIISVVNDKT